MRFEIIRASSYPGGNKPCDNAIAVEKSNSDGTSKWTDWEIEIGTINDLVALSQKEGQLIFDPTTIWIYDDYME